MERLFQVFFKRSKGEKVLLSLLACLMVLAACSTGSENHTTELPPDSKDGILIYAALNPLSKQTQTSLDDFNKSHLDVQIEVRDYSDEGGPQRLLVELTAGRVPDIMELHRFGGSGEEIKYDVDLFSSDRPADEYWMPYQHLAQKGYLEDLWPYIQSDPALEQEGILEAPLNAAKVNGGLYMIFKNFYISTLMGPESIVGNRYGWTFEELMDAFTVMPEGSTVLRYNATKWDVYSKLLRFSLAQYVDWDTGQSTFDSDNFRNLLTFLNSFPDEIPEETQKQTDDELIWRLKNGKQMLEGVAIDKVTEIIYMDAFWDERAAFPGYPMADGKSGSFFYPCGSVLAMSSTCQNKEAAWDYISNLLNHRYGTGTVASDDVHIPVNLTSYLSRNQNLLNASKKRADALAKDPTALAPWGLFSDKILIFPKRVASDDDVTRFETLIGNIVQIYWPNGDLSDIVWEQAQPYFAGDKTLDETVDLIQRRVALYVNEAR